MTADPGITGDDIKRINALISAIRSGVVPKHLSLEWIAMVPDWRYSSYEVDVWDDATNKNQRRREHRIWSAYRTKPKDKRSDTPTFVGDRDDAVAYLRSEWLPDAEEWMGITLQ